MTPDTNKERAEFEAWAVNEGFQIRRLHNPEAGRDYGIDSAQDAWEAWQARASLAAKAPAAEPVAVVCDAFELRWIGAGPIAQLVKRHNIKVGSFLYTAPPAPTEQWVSVAERLPEWVHRDDTPCHINGKEVPPTLTSKTVLVALDGGGVRTDKLTTIEGKSAGWWNTYGERVIAWQDTPAPPQGAAK